MYSRLDSEIHAKGTINMDYQFIAEKKSEGRKLEEFFKKYKEKYPLYYTTPTLREYIFLDGSYQFTLEIDSNLVKLLENNLRENNLGYLGTSEGWVDIRLCRK